MLWGKNAIFLLRGDIHHFCVGGIFQGKCLAVSHCEGNLQMYLPHGGHYCAHIDVASCLILMYLRGHHSGLMWTLPKGLLMLILGECWQLSLRGLLPTISLSNFLKARW